MIEAGDCRLFTFHFFKDLKRRNRFFIKKTAVLQQPQQVMANGFQHFIALVAGFLHQIGQQQIVDGDRAYFLLLFVFSKMAEVQTEFVQQIGRQVGRKSRIASKKEVAPAIAVEGRAVDSIPA